MQEKKNMKTISKMTWDPRIAQLLKENEQLNKSLNLKNVELDNIRQEAMKLSDAYIRLRALIPGALDTGHAPKPEEVWKQTEDSLKKLLEIAKIDRYGNSG